MQHAVIRGKATSTVKHPSLHGRRLLIAQPLSNRQDPHGDPVLVIDTHGAGVGDHVMISSDGKGVREMLGDPTSPARWWTLGLIDR